MNKINRQWKRQNLPLGSGLSATDKLAGGSSTMINQVNQEWLFPRLRPASPVGSSPLAAECQW